MLALCAAALRSQHRRGVAKPSCGHGAERALRAPPPSSGRHPQTARGWGPALTVASRPPHWPPPPSRDLAVGAVSLRSSENIHLCACKRGHAFSFSHSRASLQPACGRPHRPAVLACPQSSCEPPSAVPPLRGQGRVVVSTAHSLRLAESGGHVSRLPTRRGARTGRPGSEGDGSQGRAVGGPGTALPTGSSAVSTSLTLRQPGGGAHRCRCPSPRRRESPVSTCHLGKGSSSTVPSAGSPAAPGPRAVAAGGGRTGTNGRMREWEPG